MNNDLFYQLEHQKKDIKLSINKLLNTLNYTWVIKNNWLQCHAMHVFQKQGKNDKDVYNIETLSIKTSLDCMTFTSLLSIIGFPFLLIFRGQFGYPNCLIAFIHTCFVS